MVRNKYNLKKRVSRLIFSLQTKLRLTEKENNKNKSFNSGHFWLHRRLSP